MALFHTRNSTDNKSEPANRKKSASVDTVETLRTRARQRLIGSALLLLAGIITFTLLFDSKPRPIPTDIEIIIPDKDKVAPISAPTQTPAQAPAPTSAQASSPPGTHSTTSNAIAEPVTATSSVKPTDSNSAGAKTVQASSSLDAKEELITSKPVVKAEPKAAVKVEPKTESKTTNKANAKTNADDGAKAKAILEGKDPQKTPPSNSGNNAASGTDRYIVQVGAFADAAKARDVRQKVERAGLKTYTHVAKTPEGTRTRVRVGPFASRAEADKAAEKIKKLDLPAAILTL